MNDIFRMISARLLECLTPIMQKMDVMLCQKFRPVIWLFWEFSFDIVPSQVFIGHFYDLARQEGDGDQIRYGHQPVKGIRQVPDKGQVQDGA